MNSENEKKEIKIKLGTTISLILLLIVTILFIIGFVSINKIETTNLDDSNTNTVIVEFNKEDEEKEVDKQILDSDFSMQFLKLENSEQNMIYSPLSIKYALNMLKEGANGNTKTQIENVIGKQHSQRNANQQRRAVI